MPSKRKCSSTSDDEWPHNKSKRIRKATTKKKSMSSKFLDFSFLSQADPNEADRTEQSPSSSANIGPDALKGLAKADLPEQSPSTSLDNVAPDPMQDPLFCSQQSAASSSSQTPARLPDLPRPQRFKSKLQPPIPTDGRGRNLQAGIHGEPLPELFPETPALKLKEAQQRFAFASDAHGYPLAIPSTENELNCKIQNAQTKDGLTSTVNASTTTTATSSSSKIHNIRPLVYAIPFVGPDERSMARTLLHHFEASGNGHLEDAIKLKAFISKEEEERRANHINSDFHHEFYDVHAAKKVLQYFESIGYSQFEYAKKLRLCISATERKHQLQKDNENTFGCAHGKHNPIVSERSTPQQSRESIEQVGYEHFEGERAACFDKEEYENDSEAEHRIESNGYYESDEDEAGIHDDEEEEALYESETDDDDYEAIAKGISEDEYDPIEVEKEDEAMSESQIVDGDNVQSLDNMQNQIPQFRVIPERKKCRLNTVKQLPALENVKINANNRFTFDGFDFRQNRPLTAHLSYSCCKCLSLQERIMQQCKKYGLPQPVIRLDYFYALKGTIQVLGNAPYEHICHGGNNQVANESEAVNKSCLKEPSQNRKRSIDSDSEYNALNSSASTSRKKAKSSSELKVPLLSENRDQPLTINTPEPAHNNESISSPQQPLFGHETSGNTEPPVVILQRLLLSNPPKRRQKQGFQNAASTVENGIDIPDPAGITLEQLHGHALHLVAQYEKLGKSKLAEDLQKLLTSDGNVFEDLNQEDESVNNAVGTEEKVNDHSIYYEIPKNLKKRQIYFDEIKSLPPITNLKVGPGNKFEHDGHLFIYSTKKPKFTSFVCDKCMKFRRWLNDTKSKNAKHVPINYFYVLKGTDQVLGNEPYEHICQYDTRETRELPEIANLKLNAAKKRFAYKGCQFKFLKKNKGYSTYCCAGCFRANNFLYKKSKKDPSISYKRELQSFCVFDGSDQVFGNEPYRHICQNPNIAPQSITYASYFKNRHEKVEKSDEKIENIEQDKTVELEKEGYDDDFVVSENELNGAENPIEAAEEINSNPGDTAHSYPTFERINFDDIPIVQQVAAEDDKKFIYDNYRFSSYYSRISRSGEERTDFCCMKCINFYNCCHRAKLPLPILQRFYRNPTTRNIHGYEPYQHVCSDVDGRKKTLWMILHYQKNPYARITDTCLNVNDYDFALERVSSTFKYYTSYKCNCCLTLWKLCKCKYPGSLYLVENVLYGDPTKPDGKKHICDYELDDSQKEFDEMLFHPQNDSPINVDQFHELIAPGGFYAELGLLLFGFEKYYTHKPRQHHEAYFGFTRRTGTIRQRLLSAVWFGQSVDLPARVKSHADGGPLKSVREEEGEVLFVPLLFEKSNYDKCRNIEAVLITLCAMGKLFFKFNTIKNTVIEQIRDPDLFKWTFNVNNEFPVEHDILVKAFKQMLHAALRMDRNYLST